MITKNVHTEIMENVKEILNETEILKYSNYALLNTTSIPRCFES